MNESRGGSPMNDTEVKVVTVRPNGTVRKDEYAQSWQGKYILPVLLVLEDGQVIESTNRHKLQRDAKAEAVGGDQHPTNMKAIFHDGKYWGVTMTYGVIGMTPVEV
jgi:hypothetical protein